MDWPATDGGTVKSASFFSWEGTLTLPTPRSAKKHRIYVAEFEQHKVVSAGDDQSRVTYLDAIETGGASALAPRGS